MRKHLKLLFMLTFCVMLCASVFVFKEASASGGASLNPVSQIYYNNAKELIEWNSVEGADGYEWTVNDGEWERVNTVFADVSAVTDAIRQSETKTAIFKVRAVSDNSDILPSNETTLSQDLTVDYEWNNQDELDLIYSTNATNILLGYNWENIQTPSGYFTGNAFYGSENPAEINGLNEISFYFVEYRQMNIKPALDGNGGLNFIRLENNYVRFSKGVSASSSFYGNTTGVNFETYLKYTVQYGIFKLKDPEGYIVDQEGYTEDQIGYIVDVKLTTKSIDGTDNILFTASQTYTKYDLSQILAQNTVNITCGASKETIVRYVKTDIERDYKVDINVNGSVVEQKTFSWEKPYDLSSIDTQESDVKWFYKDGEKTVEIPEKGLWTTNFLTQNESGQYVGELFAIVDYSIEYVVENGTNNPENPTTYNSLSNIALKAPVLDSGYIFKGWFTDEAYTNQITEIKELTGDLTLYAKVEKYVVEAVTANDPYISINAVTDSAENELTLTIADSSASDRTYQYWVRKSSNIDSINSLNSSAYIWTLVSSFSGEKTVTISDAATINDNGSYYILVRILENGIATSYYTSISVTETQPHITSVTFNEKAPTEINFMDITDSIEIKFTGTATSYTLTDGLNSYTSDSEGVIAYTPLKGRYNITLTAIGGQVVTYNVKGIDMSEDYAVISKVLANGGKVGISNPIDNNIAEISVETTDIGTPAAYFAKIKLNGTQIYSQEVVGNAISISKDLTEFDLTEAVEAKGYGIYTLTVELWSADGNYLIDSYVDYLNYARPEAVTVSANIAVTEVTGTYEVKPDSNLTNAEYQLIRWDAMGERVIANWAKYEDTTNALFTFSVVDSAIYRYELRVKGDNSGSWESREIITIGGEVQRETANFIVTDTLGNVATKVNAREAYRFTLEAEETESMYLFVISGYGIYTRETIYSPVADFSWVANKAGSFTVEVRKQSKDKFGFADSLGYFSFTVK